MNAVADSAATHLYGMLTITLTPPPLKTLPTPGMTHRPSIHLEKNTSTRKETKKEKKIQGENLTDTGTAGKNASRRTSKQNVSTLCPTQLNH